jgi:biotin carboxyl carrier protein
VNVEVGKPVREGDVLVVLESMKMEIPLLATRDGVVSRCVCSRDHRFAPGSVWSFWRKQHDAAV